MFVLQCNNLVKGFVTDIIERQSEITMLKALITRVRVLHPARMPPYSSLVEGVTANAEVAG